MNDCCFYVIAQFVPWNFAKFWKQSLGFVVISIGTGISVKQKKNALFKLMNTLTKLQKVSDSFENIVVKIRFIYSIHLKADQIYF